MGLQDTREFLVIKILKVQLEDLDMEHYKNKEVTYILRLIAKEFIKKFYKGII